MLVKMLSIAAGPDFVLEPGHVYNLPADLAKRLLAGHVVRGESVDADGNRSVITTLRYAEKAPPGSRVTPIPPRPDPEDLPELTAEEVELLDVEE
jgi:hypothetical protein